MLECGGCDFLERWHQYQKFDAGPKSGPFLELNLIVPDSLGLYAKALGSDPDEHLNVPETHRPVRYLKVRRGTTAEDLTLADPADTVPSCRTSQQPRLLHPRKCRVQVRAQQIGRAHVCTPVT